MTAAITAGEAPKWQCRLQFLLKQLAMLPSRIPTPPSLLTKAHISNAMINNCQSLAEHQTPMMLRVDSKISADYCNAKVQLENYRMWIVDDLNLNVGFHHKFFLLTVKRV